MLASATSPLLSRRCCSMKRSAESADGKGDQHTPGHRPVRKSPRLMLGVKIKQEGTPFTPSHDATAILKEEVKVESGPVKAPVKTVKVELVGSPYPNLSRPTPVECQAARDALAALHGEPRRETLEREGCILEQKAQTVLDSLVRTILSQNTTDVLSKRAFDSLKRVFPTYKGVLAASNTDVEASIKVGGLAQTKVQRIKAILTTILAERPDDCIGGEPSLEYLREMSTEDIKRELSRFKGSSGGGPCATLCKVVARWMLSGVGAKTIACVLMFTLAREEFPVDTHVWHISKRLNWVPGSATRDQTYDHLNKKVPDAIKYDLHVLMVKHGKHCASCAKGKPQFSPLGPCPLVVSKLKTVEK